LKNNGDIEFHAKGSVAFSWEIKNIQLRLLSRILTYDYFTSNKPNDT
jgi:hypothetical protein